MNKELKFIIAIGVLVACIFILSISIISIGEYKIKKLYITHGYE